MAYIYAFEPDASDCSTIGLVGALLAQDARFELRAGEFGELTFKHPIDPYGKWKALVSGAILKTMVPMRICPALTDGGAYVGSVDVYRVSNNATKNQRYIYSQPRPDETSDPKKKKDKKKKLLKIGTKVIVTAVVNASDPETRYKVKSGKISGYMENAGLEITQQNVPIPETEAGLETVEKSYAVRQQLFRVVEVRPSSQNGGEITVKALRIAYDLLGNLTSYRSNGSITCKQACDGILGSTVIAHEFRVYTDIADKHVGFDARDKNPIAALVDPESGVCARWNAEIVADDYDIYILRRAGIDRGITVSHGKNLVGIEVTTNSEGVANAIRPRGENKSGGELYLDGRVVNGRHGYNYNSGTGTCANWLPNGFKFYEGPNGALNGRVIVRTSYDNDYWPQIALLNVEDARVDEDKADRTAAVARTYLADAAIDAFRGGCDVPEISMRVDFIMLGDTQEYAQYKNLEALFVYDPVSVSHRRLGIYAQINLAAITWDVAMERVIGGEFGSLKNVTAKIHSSQISSISGMKIIPDTIGPAQLSEESVSLKHVQANSINTDALQAGCVTALKLAAGAAHLQALEAITAKINDITAQTIETDELAAAFAHLFSVVATQIQTGSLTADTLSAVIADVITIQARVGDFDLATVTNLVASALTLKSGYAGSMMITNLAVVSANMLNVTISKLVMLGEDGKYYEVTVGSDGIVHTAEYTPTQEEIDSGRTTDGRQIVSQQTIVAEDINGQSVTAVSGTFDSIISAALTAGQITAQDALLASATIPALYTTSINAIGSTIDISANETILLNTGDNSRGLRRVLRLDGDGVHVGDSATTNELLLDSESVNVRMGGQTFSRFAGNYAQFGDYQIRRTTDGGLVFKRGG